MRNFMQRGEAVEYTAGADLVAGQLVHVGDRFGVAMTAIANGAQGVLVTHGVFEFDKPQASGFGQGDLVYMDDSGDLTPDADNGETGPEPPHVDYDLVGYAAAPAAAESEALAGDGDATVLVAINA